MTKHFVKKSFTLLSLLVALINNALGDEVRIGNVDELVQFKDSVNSGSTYEGTTVFLDSDLDFTEKEFEPIGDSLSNYFRGVFNGQGHAIINLAMNSSSQYVGLFGCSNGLTIRNVILDSSCSITSSRSDSGNSHVGIIGNCNTYDGPCIIENSVNMASLSFTGSIGGFTLYLGGIAGCLFFYSYDITFKNCANYGDLKHSGANSNSQIGGIAGNSYGAPNAATYVYNCLNYGTITYSGTTNDLYLGGIIGFTQYTTIKDCVSSGKIESTGTVNTDNYIGSFVGYIHSDVSLSYCYITSELSGHDKYFANVAPSESNVLSYDSTTFELSEAASVGSYTGTSLIDALNAAVDVNTGYSHWLLNKDSKTVSFTINGRAAPISLNSQIMVLPSLMSEGSMSFDGWYTDNALTTPLASYEVTSDTALYGRYGIIITVSFDANGGTCASCASKKVLLSGAYGDLPEATNTGYLFAGWYTAQTGGDKVESGSIVTTSSDHTLYAQWTANKYTLSFEVNGGTSVDSITQDYNTVINIPNPTKTGYTFGGWYSDSGLTTPFTATTMPAENKKLYAKWTANKYTLSFEVNGGTSVDSITQDYNTAINIPNPTKTGYTFGGWYSDSALTIPFTATTMPAENKKLYAKWTANSYTLSFEVNGGTSVDSITQDYNTAINIPNPTKTGYTFGGWYSDSALTTPFTATTMPAENKKLYAKWTANSYTLSFEVNGGTSVDSITQDYNTAINIPNPTKTGYTFGGWYSDSALTTPFTATTMPAENKKLYAKWTASKYTITFDFDNGTVSDAVLDFDTAIEYPEDMAREGFTFIEWKPKPETMPAENVTVKAQWTITNPTECVDIMLSQEGMTEDDVEEVIKEFVPKGAKFRVAIIESSSEGTRAGAKFNNKEKAKEFVEAVIASSDAEKSGIKTVGFFPSGCSFATSLGLSVLAYFLAYLLAF